MGRGSRLALGAIAAAVAAGQVAPSHLGAVDRAGDRGDPARRGSATAVRRAGAAARRAAAPGSSPSAWPSFRRGRRPLATVPDGDGPWRLVVEATGSPRDGQQSATLATAPDAMPGVHGRGDAARPIRSSCPATWSPSTARSARARTRPTASTCAGSVPSGTLTSTVPDDRAGARQSRPAPRAAAARLRRSRLTRVLPEPEAGLAAGILIGLRDLVDRDLAAAFTTAGVSHVVAISGWNIAIVAAAIGAMAGRLGRRRRSVVTIVAIVALRRVRRRVRLGGPRGADGGRRPPGARERASRPRGRRARLGRHASCSSRDPALIGDAGFQLSSLATAGLIAWATPLTEWLERLGGGRLPGWLAESLGVSLAAQAATLPIILVVVRPAGGRCRRWSTSLVVPLVAPAMAAGVLALAGGVAVVGRGAAGRRGGPGGARLGRPPAARRDRRRGGGPPVRERHARAAAGRRGGRASVAGDRGRRRRSASPTARPGRRADEPADPARAPPDDHAARPAGAAPSTSSRAVCCDARASLRSLVSRRWSPARSSSPDRPGVARITVLDVGQGDAILVEGSRGGRLLIDGGPDPEPAAGRPRCRRMPPWDRRIDAVILSPPARGSRRRSRAAARALPGRPGLRAGHARARARATRPGCATWRGRVRRSGSGWPPATASTVDEIALRVLWPVRGRGARSSRRTAGPASTTSRSCCSARSGSVAFLLAGDVEEGIDPSLARRTVCRTSTSSRSPTTAAGRRRRRRSSMPSGRRSRSRRPAPGTRTAIRRRRRSIDSRHRVPASCGPTATGRSSSRSTGTG